MAARGSGEGVRLFMTWSTEGVGTPTVRFGLLDLTELAAEEGCVLSAGTVVVAERAVSVTASPSTDDEGTVAGMSFELGTRSTAGGVSSCDAISGSSMYSG
eukprot:2161168-Rhodomonas_salina.1